MIYSFPEDISYRKSCYINHVIDPAEKSDKKHNGKEDKKYLIDELL